MTGEHGPCESCEQHRDGSLVTQLTLAALPDHYRPHAQQAQQARTAEQATSTIDIVGERESNRRHGTTMYTRRPSGQGFSYCGVYEFSNIYASCEVKNLDETCDQFTPRRSDDDVHDCATCAHQRRPSPRVDEVLHQFLQPYAVGRQLLATTVEPALAAAVDAEAAACVEHDGFLPQRPSFLPWCEALSTTNHLVGPVVNSAHRCTTWTPRGEPEFADVDARLDELVAVPRRLHELTLNLDRRREMLRLQGSPAPTTDLDRAALDAEYGQRLLAAETNAQADVLAFCLARRGADPELVASVCETWVPKGWVPDAPFEDPYHLLESADTGAAGAAPAASDSPPVPFPVAPLVSYRHPTDVDTGFLVVMDAVQALLVYAVHGAQVVVDLRSFPYATWSRLQTAAGPQPVSFNVQLPGVAAVWLDPQVAADTAGQHP